MYTSCLIGSGIEKDELVGIQKCICETLKTFTTLYFNDSREKRIPNYWFCSANAAICLICGKNGDFTCK